jgi:hypothetical protein
MFADARPCPVDCTPALPLLADWDPRDPAASRPLVAPAGFRALLRLLHTPPLQLNRLATPLTMVNLVGDAVPSSLRLDSRLGCGGRCDAYRVSALDSGSGPPLVLKLPRSANEAVTFDLTAEANALVELERAGAPDSAVPRLAAQGIRDLPSRCVDAHTSTLSWPVLLLSPAGIPLSTALVEALAAPGQTHHDVRRNLADVVVVGILRGLRATHGAGLVHCDVRPTNVIIVPDASGASGAMLVDYGMCRKKNAAWPRLGDRSFAALHASSRDNCAATAGLDLFSAALVWLAVAYGSGGSISTPWGALGNNVHNWLLAAAATASQEDATVLRSLRWHLRNLQHTRAVLSSTVDYYTWPWPTEADTRVTRTQQVVS